MFQFEIPCFSAQDYGAVSDHMAHISSQCVNMGREIQVWSSQYIDKVRRCSEETIARHIGLTLQVYVACLFLVDWNRKVSELYSYIDIQNQPRKKRAMFRLKPTILLLYMLSFVVDLLYVFHMFYFALANDNVIQSMEASFWFHKGNAIFRFCNRWIISRLYISQEACRAMPNHSTLQFKGLRTVQQ